MTEKLLGMSVRMRLTLALVVLLSLWGAVASAMLFEMSRIHARADRISVEHLPRLRRANLLIEHSYETARTMGEILLARDPGLVDAGLQRVLSVRRQVEEHLHWFQVHPGSAELRAMQAETGALRARYWGGQDHLFVLMRQDPEIARVYYLNDVLRMQQRYVHSLEQLTRMEDAQASATALRAHADYQHALYLLLLASGTALLLAGGVGLVILRNVTRPLEAAAALARSVAEGNLDVDLAGRRRDEVGQLRTALQHMATSLREDRTRRQDSEQALRSSHARLRELAAHAENLQERERLSLARELHDELGQSMTALRMELSMLRMRFGHLAPGLAEQVAVSKDIVDAMLRTMRGVVASLRPGPLDAGLVAATEWLLANLVQRAGLQCQLDAPTGDLRLEPQLCTAAFRILQEALTNVVRHAHASSVQVVIGLDDDGFLSLVIADDGIGMPDRQTGQAFGLLGMRERALMFGGDIDIEQTPGGGTTLRATLAARERLQA